MSDNITLPRADALQIREALVSGEKLYAALDALDAALAEPDAIARAVEAEREACAKLCDGWTHADGDSCAAAIRARGEK
jgi:hypothetical protein